MLKRTQDLKQKGGGLKMSIEFTAKAMHKMSVLELKEFDDANKSNLFEEIDEMGMPGRTHIYFEGLKMVEKTIKTNQNTQLHER